MNKTDRQQFRSKNRLKTCYSTITSSAPPSTVSPGLTLISLTSPADRAAHLVFHFHRLDDHQSLALFDGVAHRHQHRDNLPGHRHRNHLTPLKLQTRLRSRRPARAARRPGECGNCARRRARGIHHPCYRPRFQRSDYRRSRNNWSVRFFCHRRGIHCRRPKPGRPTCRSLRSRPCSSALRASR